MENYSAINPLLLSQPSGVETIKNLNQQKDINKDAASLKKASQDFESILINYVIKAMWQTVPKADLSGEDNMGMETYTEIMHTAISQDIVAKGGLGIAPIIYKQLMYDKGLTEKPLKPPLLKNDNVVDLTREDKEEFVHSKDGKDKNGVNPS